MTCHKLHVITCIVKRSGRGPCSTVAPRAKSSAYTPAVNPIATPRSWSSGAVGFRLDLSWSPRRGRGADRDHEVAPRHIVLSPYHLPYRTDCVDDRRARRVCGERSERFDRATAVRPTGQGEPVG